MSRLIDADLLEEILDVNIQKLQDEIDDVRTYIQKEVYEAQLFSTMEMIRVIREQPTAFDVEKAIGQYKWERDIAMYQLEQLGIGFGQKLEDEVIEKVKEVIRCE